MFDTLLKRILTAAYLPPALHEKVLSTYAELYPTELSYNSSLGASAVQLLGPRYAATDTVRVLSSGDPAVLDAWLNSRDVRTQPVEAVLKTWRLSPFDQQRMLAHVNVGSGEGATSSASDLFFSSEATPTTRLALSERVDKKHYATWLAGDLAIDDDEAFAHLVSVQYQDSMSVLIPVLMARPSLRTRAFDEDIPSLMRAACWTVLPLSYHEKALQFAKEDSATRLYYSAAVGLLAQCFLAADMRAELLDYVKSHGLSADADESGVRPLGSHLHTTVPLSQLSKRAVDDVLDILSPPPDHSAACTVATSSIIELSSSPHLTPQQRDRVIVALLMAAERDYLNRDAVLIPHLRRVAAEIDPTRAPSIVLSRYRHLTRVADLVNNVPAAYAAPERSELKIVPRQVAPGHLEGDQGWYYGVKQEALGDTLLHKVGFQEILHFPRYFADVLGEADTPASFDSWVTFFDIIADDPAIPLTMALSTARQLALTS